MPHYQAQHVDFLSAPASDGSVSYAAASLRTGLRIADLPGKVDESAFTRAKSNAAHRTIFRSQTPLPDTCAAASGTDPPLAQQYSHVGYALLHSVPTK